MKKYNLSKIMKRAWELVKKASMTISSALKKSWREAKGNVRSAVKMEISRNDIITIDAHTGKVTGRTYYSKEFLKKNFAAKWNPETKTWTVDVEMLNEELDQYPDYYRKYIVEEIAEKKIINKKLINKDDGFYSFIKYSDGTSEYVFIG